MRRRIGVNNILWIEVTGNMKKTEIARIYEWSAKYEGNYRYSEADKDAKSYFIPHEENAYIREYEFETIADLKAELEKIWSGNVYMEEITRTVAVAAMKNKIKAAEDKEKTRGLNEFIYTF